MPHTILELSILRCPIKAPMMVICMLIEVTCSYRLLGSSNLVNKNDLNFFRTGAPLSHLKEVDDLAYQPRIWGLCLEVAPEYGGCYLLKLSSGEVEQHTSLLWHFLSLHILWWSKLSFCSP